MDTWTLDAAEGELRTVARRALDGQPQLLVLDEGQDAVVVVADAEYRRLTSSLGGAPPPAAPAPTTGADLVAFLRNSPLAEAVAAGEFDLDALRRDGDPGRDVGLD